MHRFPNPGSDIDGFVRIFKALYEEIKDDVEFSLDNISLVLVNKNLAASSGYMGSKALEQSFNKDRSRDKLYNQSKMYAELFRSLGWFQSGHKKLNYNFTYLGKHILEFQGTPKSLVEECLLGMSFPNQIIDVKGGYRIRPFAAILKAMERLDNVISRDEMIVGPLSLSDDRNEHAFERMVIKIKGYRNGEYQISEWVDTLSKARSISKTTMNNYTRFPLAALLWTGWATKENFSVGKLKSTNYYRLSTSGLDRLKKLSEMLDLRVEDLNNENSEDFALICKYSFWKMLERSDFDLSSNANEIASNEKKVFDKFGKKELLFSPFQQIDSQKLDSIFNIERKYSHSPDKKHFDNQIKSQSSRNHFSTTLQLKSISSDSSSKNMTYFENWLRKQPSAQSQPDLAQLFVNQHEHLNQKEFYPLVANLLNLTGLNCKISRTGVGAQRWDALIKHSDDAIPIEIKSPGEEKHLSVKAFRQALENKVILMSRAPFPVKMKTTTLVVGFKSPNDRSEVNGLIEAFHKTFDVKVSYLNLNTLCQMAIAAIQQNKSVQFETLGISIGEINIGTSTGERFG